MKSISLNHDSAVLRAAVYARVSTADRQHPENQVNELRQYAKRRGWRVVDEFVDRVSGSKERRPALDKLMAAARRREFDIIAVTKLDRWSRRPWHCSLNSCSAWMTTARRRRTVALLLSQMEPSVGMVGGIYARGGTCAATVWMDASGKPFTRWKAGDVFECFALSLGCALIRAEVFKLGKPWFRTGFHWSGVRPAYLATDAEFLFCQSLHDAGYRVRAHGGVLPVHLGKNGEKWLLPQHRNIL